MTEPDNQDDLEVDGVTAHFLDVKIAQIAQGTLRLSGPVSAEEWQARTSRLFVEVRQAGRPET